MIYTIFTYFDPHVGPRVFLKIPNLTELPQLEHVPLVMDLYKKGFFVHQFAGIITANLIFEIKSPIARGGRENVMITIASKEEDNLNLRSFQEIIEYYAFQLMNINEIYKAFYLKSSVAGSTEKYKELMDFTFTLHNSLPSAQELYTQKIAKMFSYGLSPLGKDSIIKNLQQKYSIPIPPKEAHIFTGKIEPF